MTISLRPLDLDDGEGIRTAHLFRIDANLHNLGTAGFGLKDHEGSTEGLFRLSVANMLRAMPESTGFFMWNDAPAGLYEAHPHGPGAAYIALVYTAPFYRRRGVGRAGLAAVEGMLAARGCVEAVLNSGVELPENTLFYESCGWENLGPSAFDRTQLVWRRRLDTRNQKVIYA